MKINTNTDVGKIRQALKNAGFEHDCIVYNDKRTGYRRLKLMKNLSHINPQQAEKLHQSLVEQFADRLLHHGTTICTAWRGSYNAYAVQIKP